MLSKSVLPVPSRRLARVGQHRMGLRSENGMERFGFLTSSSKRMGWARSNTVQLALEGGYMGVLLLSSRPIREEDDAVPRLPLLSRALMPIIPAKGIFCRSDLHFLSRWRGVDISLSVGYADFVGRRLYWYNRVPSARFMGRVFV